MSYKEPFACSISNQIYNTGVDISFVTCRCQSVLENCGTGSSINIINLKLNLTLFPTVASVLQSCGTCSLVNYVPSSTGILNFNESCKLFH